MPERRPVLARQFDDLDQQYEASTLGMWTFLATEILFFGGLFLSYIVYRKLYPLAFAAGSEKLDLALGTINTAVLLTSSLTMALAVHAIQQNARKQLVLYLLTTIVLGFGFLAIKGIEYHHKFSEGLVPGVSFKFEGALRSHVSLFFLLYFFMTGLHGLHVAGGIGLLIVMIVRSQKFSDTYFTPVEMTGLYWHFVDIVWVFLYPLFYLIRS